MTTETINRARRYSFKFGAQLGQRLEKLTCAQAREYARAQQCAGYVWMLRRGHWCIVANYDDGTVWNGQAQCVPCKPDPHDDWLALSAPGTR